jgi:hypothetical protein
MSSGNEPIIPGNIAACEKISEISCDMSHDIIAGNIAAFLADGYIFVADDEKLLVATFIAEFLATIKVFSPSAINIPSRQMIDRLVTLNSAKFLHQTIRL